MTLPRSIPTPLRCCWTHISGAGCALLSGCAHTMLHHVAPCCTMLHRSNGTLTQRTQHVVLPRWLVRAAIQLRPHEWRKCAT